MESLTESPSRKSRVGVLRMVKVSFPAAPLRSVVQEAVVTELVTS